LTVHSFTTRAARAAYANGGPRPRRAMYREAFADWRLTLRNESGVDVGAIAAAYAMGGSLSRPGAVRARYLAKGGEFRRDRDKESARFWIGSARRARLHPHFSVQLP